MFITLTAIRIIGTFIKVAAPHVRAAVEAKSFKEPTEDLDLTFTSQELDELLKDGKTAEVLARAQRRRRTVDKYGKEAA
jgi:hypothetical protein